MDRISQKLNVEEISAIVVDVAFNVHRELGPGLLETVYEVVMAKLLADRGLSVARQKPVAVEFAGLRIDEGFRADILINDTFLVELKSVERADPVHYKQVLTYLRLLHLPLGLLINFGSALFRDGVKRIVNNHHSFAASRLRVNQIRTARQPDATGDEDMLKLGREKTVKLMAHVFEF